MVQQKGMDRVFFILVTLGALCIIYPLIWAFLGSFKTTAEVFSTGMPGNGISRTTQLRFRVDGGFAILQTAG